METEPDRRRAVRACRPFRYAACVLLLVAGGVLAQLPSLPGLPAATARPEGVAEKDADAAAATLARQREALARELAVAQARVESIDRNDEATRPPPGTPESEVSDRNGMAHQLVAMLQQQMDVADRIEQSERARQAAEEEERSWSGFASPNPQSVVALDAIRDDAEAARTRIALMTARRTMLQRFTTEIEPRLKSGQAAARMAAEAADAAHGTPQAARLDWLRDIATLRAQMEVATQGRMQLGLRNIREETTAAETQLRLAERKLEAAGHRGVLADEDHARAVAEVDSRRRGADRDIAQADRDVTAATEALAAAERKLAALRAAPGTGDAAGREQRIEAAAYEVALRRDLLQNAALRADLVKDYLMILAGERTMWDVRREILSANALGARAAYERLSGPLAGIQARRDYIEQELVGTGTRIGELETKQRAATGAEAAHLASLVATWRARETALRDAIARGRPLERLLTRFKAELEGRREASLAERARDLAAGALLAARRLWNYEMFTVDDTFETSDGRRLAVSRSITIGKTVGAVLIVVVGYLLVRFVMRRVERTLVARKRLAVQSAALLRNWALFVASTILVVFALASASIPITVFAFMGGALAIAAGFGLQTLLKNLVAGVILLIERPLRLGDLVEVDGQRGRVTEIGIRASTIRTADGIESLIPNSTFLEGRLVNWTYSDTRNRQTILVGVAYGTPLRMAGDVLAGVLDRHGLVLKEPPPQVYLDDYGDSAIRFALTYWVEMIEGNDVRRLRSDIMHMIDSAFAEAGIAMPFAQRDVHLDIRAPLRVEVVPGAPGATPA